MNNQFSSSRWYGRLLGMLLNIASKKGVRFASREEMTLLNLFVKVAEVSNENDKTCISQLMKIWSEEKKYEEENGIKYSAAEEKELQDKGVREANIVLKAYGDSKRLLDEQDFCAEEERWLAEAKRKRDKRNKKILRGIAAVILILVVYNLPFFKEWRFYNDVVDDRTVSRCNDYYREYSDGRHYEEVMSLELELTDNPFPVVMRYLKRFPNGKYQDEFNEKCDELWDEEIAKYKNRDKTNDNPESVRYMEAMLQHMKKHRINTVLLEIKPHVGLKDYEEYDEKIRNFMELLYSNKGLPLKENMVSLKENFAEGDRSTLTMILADGVKKSFEKMFSSDIVSVVTAEEDSDDKSPRMVFDYVVKNQGLDEDIPNIWTYTTNDVAKAYLLGIDVTFNVNFSIPDSDVFYTYSEVGEPGEEISGIENIRDGYRQMTQVCFAKFSNKMSENLGLERTY